MSKTYEGYLSGWRAWFTSRDRSSPSITMLRSIYMGFEWPTRTPLMAECRFPASHILHSRRCTTSPNSTCQYCGVYAHTKVHHLAPELLRWIRGDFYAGLVIGRVAMWGRIIKHEWGYRSQYAYPQELWVAALRSTSPPVETLATELAAYGVPVHTRSKDAVSVASAFGLLPELLEESWSDATSMPQVVYHPEYRRLLESLRVDGWPT